MTSRKEKTILIGLSAVAAIGAMLLASPDARADVNPDDARLFCQRLDVDSSPASFLTEAQHMIDDGLTIDQAADTMSYAVTWVCPEFADDLERAAKQAEKKTPLLRAV